MKPAPTAALVAAVLAVAALGGRLARSRPPASSPAAHAPASAASAECPPRTLPDDGVCIPVPEAPATAETPIRRTLYEDRIFRRPDRPADYYRYRLPFASRPARFAPAANALDGGVPPAGLLVTTARGSAVRAVRLDGQTGPTTLLYAGRLVGASAVTEHVVTRKDGARTVLLVFGDLAAPPVLAPHAQLSEGAALGTAGSRPVYFEARVCRTGVEPRTLPPDQILNDAFTVSEDVRNVLSLP